MSEWLDIMLEEIARKKREAEAAAEEQRTRASSQKPDGEPADEAQSK